MRLLREECRTKVCSTPPRYDGRLLQEGLGGCPWRIIVASVLLCRARRAQAEPALRELFRRWPNPASLCRADADEVAEVVRPCGLHRNRARTLMRMSTLWFSDAWSDVRDLPGVGIYVADAVGVFCFDSEEVLSGDRALLAYVHARQAALHD